jgi:CheY-like chemotaxis protein
VSAISGRPAGGHDAAARAAGMNFYFTKPVSPGKLAEALAGLAA